MQEFRHGACNKRPVRLDAKHMCHAMYSLSGNVDGKTARNITPYRRFSYLISMNETTAADSSHHQQSNEVSLTITLADLETQSTVSTLTGHLTTAKKVAPIKFLLLSILSHALWSCYPVLSRYLQVFASPTLNGMVFVSTSRTAATMLLLLVNMGHAIIPSIVWDCGKPASSQTQEDIAGRETDEEDDRIKEDTSEVSDTNFIRYKLQVLVIFGCASALRAMFAVTAARLTLAYNIGTHL